MRGRSRCGSCVGSVPWFRASTGTLGNRGRFRICRIEARQSYSLGRGSNIAATHSGACSGRPSNAEQGAGEQPLFAAASCVLVKVFRRS